MSANKKRARDSRRGGSAAVHGSRPGRLRDGPEPTPRPTRVPLEPPLPADAETQVLGRRTDVAIGGHGGLLDETVSERLDELVAPSDTVAKACLTVMRGAQVGRLYELASGEAVLGRSEEAAIAIADRAVSRRHAVIHSSPLGFVISDLESTNGLFVNGKRSKRRVLRDGDRIQFGTSTVLKFSYQDALEESLQRRLYESATRDAQLGIHNKQYFLDSLKAAFAKALRRQLPLSLLVLDVDHFKHVNDQHGHLVGDRVLQEIAALIEKSIRTEDVFARFGGEEFVLLLEDSPRDPTLLVAERIRRSIETHRFQVEERELCVTISIGVSICAVKSFPTPESLIAGADAALYEAKRGGRNRVECRQASEPPAGT